MFELVDLTNQRLGAEYKTLAAALSAAKAYTKRGIPWKIYDPEGCVVRTYGD